MARGLDHIVHAVADLDAAAALYARLGFQVGARNRHPPSWGTQNHVIQLPGTFIELLAVADATGIAPHAPRFFSFGAFNRDYLARGQGLSMLALEGRGAVDAEAFRAAGIGDFDLYEFEREGRRPDGTPIKVAFALAFASDPAAQDIGFFTCQHRHPENFWNPAFQVHANTAVGVAGVVLAADRPADHLPFLAAFIDVREMLATSGGITAYTPRGEITIMEPDVFRGRFGVAPSGPLRGGRIGALRIRVRDLGTVVETLRTSGIKAHAGPGHVVVGPDAALGAVLVFEAAG